MLLNCAISLLINLDHAADRMIHDYGKRIRRLCTRSEARGGVLLLVDDVAGH